MKPGVSFKQDVYKIVASIPKGKVMTYGDIALLCGHAYAARVVGSISHYGPSELPWQRVVNRFGGLAAGYPGGIVQHRRELELDDVPVSDQFIVSDFESRRWHPN